MHRSYAFDYNYTSIHVANILEISNIFPPLSQHGVHAVKKKTKRNKKTQRWRETPGPRPHRLHDTELVGGVVEERVEGVPFCRDTEKGLRRLGCCSDHPCMSWNQAAANPSACSTCLGSFAFLPEPRGRCWRGAKPRERCFEGSL